MIIETEGRGARGGGRLNTKLYLVVNLSKSQSDCDGLLATHSKHHTFCPLPSFSRSSVKSELFLLFDSSYCIIIN